MLTKAAASLPTGIRSAAAAGGISGKPAHGHKGPLLGFLSLLLRKEARIGRVLRFRVSALTLGHA